MTKEDDFKLSEFKPQPQNGHTPTPDQQRILYWRTRCKLTEELLLRAYMKIDPKQNPHDLQIVVWQKLDGALQEKGIALPPEIKKIK